MQRRQFLRTTGLGGMGVAMMGAGCKTIRPHGWAPPTVTLLSENGCGRATAYAEANKILTLGDRTHVTWLESVGKTFRVRIRSLDRRSGEWSPPYTVGEAFDNHGGPALAADSEGFLHIVYYPHHHPFRYRRSSRPNDAADWGDEVRFGTRCTYPTLVVGPDDTLYLTGRESNQVGEPWVVNLYSKKPGEAWRGPTPILVAEEPGYSHFQEALAWGPDHRTLHLSTRMYGGKPGRPHTVGYLRTRDFGATWETAAGTPVDLPATSATVDIIDNDGGRGGRGFRCGAMAVNGDGTPLVLYGDTSHRPPQAWLASPEADGEWAKHPLLEKLAKSLPDHCLFMPGGLTVTESGRVCAALTVCPWPPPEPGKDQTWGGAADEIAWIESDGAGRHARARVVSNVDEQRANWLPNVERPTGFNRVTHPGLVYTSGPPGDGCSDILANRVYWVG